MVIHGTGCCLIDFLYAREDFSGPPFRAASSRKPGDGGLSPGKLVFAEDFERFMGRPYEEALAFITGGKKPLTDLLKKARALGAVTVVNLVYDYQSEQKRGNEKWKLGSRDDAYQYIDILIADREEALKTSGRPGAEEAANWFISRGTGAAVISDGARPVFLASGKGIFLPLAGQTMEVCEAADRDWEQFPERRGDTTGCGDNFAGGIIAGTAEQMALVKPGRLDLRELCVQGITAGGFARFTLGGTFYESAPGEKRKLLEPYMADYRRQCGLTLDC
jgi:sugar/nucleoside kinase (ribokinase family)